MLRTTVLALSALALGGCVGSTGGDQFEFGAFARGAADARAPFVNGKGYTVTLARANVHIGAVYLNRAVPTSVSSNTSCTLSGIYVAEVTGPLEVDALSPEPQPFPASGEATADEARTAEVWLTGGDVNEPHDATVILDVAGDAERAGRSRPFEGRLSIGENRLEPAPPAEPGQRPICKERIVSPIAVDVTPARGEELALTLDPRRMFANVDFSELPAGDDGTLHFDDDPETATPASTNLYIGLRATSSVYEFAFEPGASR
jgi:hypothetical protein